MIEEGRLNKVRMFSFKLIVVELIRHSDMRIMKSLHPGVLELGVTLNGSALFKVERQVFTLDFWALASDTRLFSWLVSIVFLGLGNMFEGSSKSLRMSINILMRHLLLGVTLESRRDRGSLLGLELVLVDCGSES